MQRLLDSPWEDLNSPVIMIVEDSDEDFYAFLRATRNLNRLTRSPFNFLRFQDGDEALDYLFRQEVYENLNAPLPVAILLDLNLPSTDGRDIIKQVKQSPTLKMIPIIVLTTSSNTLDIETCYRYGANSYLLKAMGTAEMQEAIQSLFQFWFHFAVLPYHALLSP
ncbi:Response regulatory domain-containing protein [Tumidithrix helvetica PCC 7403]|uniref:response regulator n=1 Tax=Tumidithrix helvetica TaxID=3457545 RepID=UPI003C8343DF